MIFNSPQVKRLSRAGLWLGVHAFLLVIFLDHSDRPRVFFNRYNLPYAVGLALLLLIGILGTLLIMRGVTYRLPARLVALRRPMFYLAVTLIGTLIIAAVWATLSLQLTALQRELLRSYLTLAALAAVYLLLFWQAAEVRVAYFMWLLVGGLAAAAAFVVALHYMDRFPRLNTIDELQNYIVDWTVAHTGLLGNTIYRQMIPMPVAFIDGPHYPLGLMLRLIGDGLWQARFARLLLVSLALPFIYLAGKRMYGKRAALFSVVFAVILIIPTNYVRPDFFLGVMLSVAIYLYTRAQTTRRPWMHYLTGFCLALGIEGHPLVYRFGVAFVLLYAIRWVYQMWQSRHIYLDGRLIALSLGGLTGILIWTGLHVLPDIPQAWHFIQNYMPGGTASTTGAISINPPTLLLTYQLQVWVATNPFEFLFVILGALLALREFKHGDRMLLMLLVVSELLLLVTHYYLYREFYQVHSLPIFALLAGRFLADITDRSGSRNPKGYLPGLVLAGMVFAVALLVLLQDAQSASVDPIRDNFTSIGQQLKTNLPQNAIIVGSPDYFPEMRSSNYYGLEAVTTPNWFLVKYQGLELWQVTQPDIFVLTPNLDVRRYIDFPSVYQYIADNNFLLARCFSSGTLTAEVYVRQMPPGWTALDYCTNEDYDRQYFR